MMVMMVRVMVMMMKMMVMNVKVMVMMKKKNGAGSGAIRGALLRVGLWGSPEGQAEPPLNAAQPALGIIVAQFFLN